MRRKGKNCSKKELEKSDSDPRDPAVWLPVSSSHGSKV